MSCTTFLPGFARMNGSCTRVAAGVGVALGGLSPTLERERPDFSRPVPPVLPNADIQDH